MAQAPGIEIGNENDLEIQQNAVIDQNCPVCLEPLQTGESVSWSKYLPNCKHTFHTECINTWLERHSDCPCCRRCLYTREILVDKNKCFALGRYFGRNRSEDSLLAQSCETIRREREDSNYYFGHGFLTPAMLSAYQDARKLESHDSDMESEEKSIS